MKPIYLGVKKTYRKGSAISIGDSKGRGKNAGPFSWLIWTSGKGSMDTLATTFPLLVYFYLVNCSLKEEYDCSAHTSSYGRNWNYFKCFLLYNKNSIWKEGGGIYLMWAYAHLSKPTHTRKTCIRICICRPSTYYICPHAGGRLPPLQNKYLKKTCRCTAG
jgi:hypothetical protein